MAGVLHSLLRSSDFRLFTTLHCDGLDLLGFDTAGGKGLVSAGGRGLCLRVLYSFTTPLFVQHLLHTGGTALSLQLCMNWKI